MKNKNVNVFLNKQKNKQKVLKNPISYAKPSYKYMYHFGKGLLALSGSAMDFLLSITPYVDFDNRINISLEEIQRELSMQSSTLERVKAEAEKLGFLYEKDGHTYSTFHVQIDEDVHGLQYMRLLDEFLSPTFRNYSLNLKRLFCYFSTQTLVGRLEVSIEHLIDLKIRDSKYKDAGIKYFPSFTSLVNALVTLIQHDQITIELLHGQEKKRGRLLSAGTKDAGQALIDFYGYEKGESRTSLRKAEKHKICIRMSDRVKNNTFEVKASEQEFFNEAESYGLGSDWIKGKLLNTIISYKNELINKFGETGLFIYRKALSTYFEKNRQLVEYHFDIEKAANYFTDFYLLEEIKNLLVVAARLLNQATKAIKNENSFTYNQYEIRWGMLPQLIAYYIDKGSANHVIQLDGLLDSREEFTFYDGVPFAAEAWRKLESVSLAVYQSEFESVNSEITFGQWKENIRRWADQGLLVQKEKFQQAVEEVKKAINIVTVFLTKYKRYEPEDSQISNGAQLSKNRVPLYNWLVD